MVRYGKVDMAKFQSSMEIHGQNKSLTLEKCPGL